MHHFIVDKYLDDMILRKQRFILGNSTFYRGLWHEIYRNNPKNVLLGWFNHELQSFVSPNCVCNQILMF